MLDPVEKRVCFVCIQKNLSCLSIGFLEQGMIWFVRLQHAKNCFRAPVHLFARTLVPRVIAWHHQASLGDAAELPFHQFGPAQGQTQILLRSFALETKSPILQRKLLEPPERKEKARIVDCDEGVAATAVFHAPSYDTRKGVIGAAADEGMEKIMRKIVIAIQFDQHRITRRHVRNCQLRAKLFDDCLSIC